MEKRTLPPKAPFKLANCAIYSRVSTEEQAKGDYSSTDAQLDACLRFIKRQHEKGWRHYPKTYCDPGVSGKTLNRPAIQELLKDIKAGLIQIVVIYKLDRISRDHKDSVWLLEFFKEHKVDLYESEKKVDFEDPEGWFTNSLLMILAQRERMVTSKRTTDKTQEARLHGFWTGGHIPLGYDKAGKRELVPNRKEAKLVRLIFKTYLELQSLDQAMKVINAKHETKQWVTEGGRNLGGRKFAKTTLFHILKNRLISVRSPTRPKAGSKANTKPSSTRRLSTKSKFCARRTATPQPPKPAQSSGTVLGCCSRVWCAARPAAQR